MSPDYIGEQVAILDRFFPSYLQVKIEIYKIGLWMYTTIVYMYIL